MLEIAYKSLNFSQCSFGVTLPLLYKTTTDHQRAAYNATQAWLNDIIHNFLPDLSVIVTTTEETR